MSPASPMSRNLHRALLKRRTLLGLAGSACMAASLFNSTSARAAAPILIQFSHVVTPETAKGRAALRFKELAEARTGGRVRVEVFPDSSLYKDREELDALRMGAVQMLAPSLSKLAGVGGGDFEAFDLPFLFPSHEAFQRVTQGPIGVAMLRKLEASGIRGLAFWDNGFKVFTANRALRSPADFDGLRIRVQASRVLVTQMKLLGADVSVGPLQYVHEMLRTQRLDGQENVPVNVVSQRIDQVQSHLTVSNHGYLAYAVIVNKAFWDKLPPDIRAILEEAMREATRFANSIAEQENTQAMARLSANPRLLVYRLTPQETEAWRTAMAPVYDRTQGWVSTDLLRSIRQVTGAPP